jgi:phage baseplate assembly protein W
MNERFRAIRYRLPAVEDTLDGGGLSADPQGRLAMVSGDASVRQALLMLFSTMRGERVGRPTYGTDLHTLAFAPNDETTSGLAMHLVRSAVREWEPRVEVVRVHAERPPEHDGTLEISLEYRVKPEDRIQALTFSLDLSEGRL